jgi:uncharacterized protein YjiS (DUF1127 family)
MSAMSGAGALAGSLGPSDPTPGTSDFGISSFQRRLASAPADSVGVLSAWWRRRRTRLILADLDDRTLADIGLSRGEFRVGSDTPYSWVRGDRFGTFEVLRRQS